MAVRLIKSERNSRKTRVAAYVRVSTNLEEQQGSYENQIGYYETFIQKNPEWEFAGVFGEKLSGTHIENRGGFRQMMQDALDRKIDLIYCKSVSRWARNTVETLETVRLLTGNQVNIVFEQEGIDTRNPAALFSLSMAATVAQSESETISENMKWVYRYRAEHGIFKPKRGSYFGFNTDDGNFTPDENAWIVRDMFEMFAAGKKICEIVDKVNSYGVLTTRGKQFSDKNVSGILKNEVYVGDVLIGKTPSRDVISKKIDEDHISRYVENHHEGIVGRELWEKVQKLFKARKKDLEIGRHNREKIMAVLRKEPGLKKGGIIARTGENFGQLLNRMKAKGLIRNEGQRWFVSDQ